MHAIAVMVSLLVLWLLAGMLGSLIGHYVENTYPCWSDLRYEMRAGFITLFVGLLFFYLFCLEQKEEGSEVVPQRIAA